MEIIVVISIIVVAGIIILLLREFNCWYLKINERIQLLKSIDVKLGQLMTIKDVPRREEKQPSISNKVDNTAPIKTDGGSWIECPQCHKINLPGHKVCFECGHALEEKTPMGLP